MEAIELYRKLVNDLRNKPSHYFDHTSPLNLHTFLQGYQHGDQGFCEYISAASDVLDNRYQPTRSIGINVLLYLNHANIEKAYNAYLDTLVQALNKDEVVAARGPLHTSLKEFFPDLRARAPMLIGSWDVRDLRMFVDGFFRALDDYGSDTTADRRNLDKFENYLRESMQLPGRWDRLLFVEDGGKGRSAALFVDVFERFLTQTQ